MHCVCLIRHIRQCLIVMGDSGELDGFHSSYKTWACIVEASRHLLVGNTEAILLVHVLVRFWEVRKR